jgi:23S rRNA-/tRNA-specific pseudouridylate synthase
VVHPGAGVSTGTLVHALLHHRPTIAGVGGADRPGIVHRLDKDTSGLMVVAKTQATHRALVAAIKARGVQRDYFALVVGRPARRRGTHRLRDRTRSARPHAHGRGDPRRPSGRHTVACERAFSGS